YLAAETGTTACEGLAAYVAHAPAAEAKARLAELARTDGREAVVTRAISLLIDLDGRAERASLVPMLEGPPGVTWAIHIALLDAIRKLGLRRPPLDHLAAIDNLHLVRAVVAVQCAERDRTHGRPPRLNRPNRREFDVDRPPNHDGSSD